MLIVTLPGICRHELIAKIAKHPLVDALRVNTGVPSPNSPYEDLTYLLERTDKPIWLDLKCRQLRVINWCIPYYGQIELNHNIKIELPARIHFRGDGWYDIQAVKGNKVFLVHPPKVAIGQGQSVNIHAKSLEIEGYFTETDLCYIRAAEKLGINNFMLSFFEGMEDIDALKKLVTDPENVNMALKIESEKGVRALDNLQLDEKIHLMVARDDLLTNFVHDPMKVISVLEKCINLDSDAIVASGIFGGLENHGICCGDISDICLLHLIEYKHFMLSDGISLRHFDEAIKLWEQYKTFEKTEFGETE